MSCFVDLRPLEMADLTNPRPFPASFCDDLNLDGCSKNNKFLFIPIDQNTNMIYPNQLIDQNQSHMQQQQQQQNSKFPKKITKNSTTLFNQDSYQKHKQNTYFPQSTSFDNVSSISDMKPLVNDVTGHTISYHTIPYIPYLERLPSLLGGDSGSNNKSIQVELECLIE